MRPMESDRGHFLFCYLTRKDEDAIQFKQNRMEHMQRNLVENLDEEESEPPVGIRVPPNQRNC